MANPIAFLVSIANNPNEHPTKRRLAQHALGELAASSKAPVVGGQYDAPLVGLPARALGAGLNAIGLLQEGSGNVAKAGTGLYAGSVGASIRHGEELTPQTAGDATLNPLVGLGLLAHLGERATGHNILDIGPLGRDAYTDAADALYAKDGGNVYERGVAANEAAAGGGSFTPRSINVGLANMVDDPLNLLGPGAEIAQANKLGPLARALAAADRVQGLPVEGVVKLAGAGKSVAARAAARRLEALGGQAAAEAAQVAPRVPLSPLRSPGFREAGAPPLPPGLLPPPPPPARLPTGPVPPLPLGSGATPNPLLVNRTPIPERLAGMFPGEYPAPPTLPDVGGDSGIIRRTLTPPLPPPGERMAQRLSSLFPGEYPAPPTTAIGGDSGPIRRLIGNPLEHRAAQSPALLGNAAAGGALRNELTDTAMRLQLGLPPRVPTPPAGGGGPASALGLAALRMGAGGAGDLAGTAAREAEPVARESGALLSQALLRGGKNLPLPFAREAAPLTEAAAGALPSATMRNPITVAQRARLGLPPEAVTLAEERAARAVPDLIDNAAPPALDGDFPALGGTREEALAQLSGDELDTLLGVAYPGDAALGNAITKYPHPVDLAEAAIERVTRDNRLAARLAGADDDLARKLAYLPEPTQRATNTIASAFPDQLDQAGADVTTLAGGGGLRNGESALYDHAGNRIDLGERAPLGGAADDEAARLADEQAMYDDQRLQVIENSPYFAAFQYFNPRGDLKAVNPITRQRIINRVGGKFGTFREGVGNVIGNGYDEVAAALLEGSQGGHNQNYGQTAEEFWTEAQKAYKEYRDLTRPRSTGLGYGGDMAAGGGGMGLLGYPGGLNGPVGRSILPAVGGGLAGAGGGAIYGAMQGDTPGERLQNALKYAVLGGGAGALAGAGGSMATIDPEVRRMLGASAKGAAVGAIPSALSGAAIGGIHGATEGDTTQERLKNAALGALEGGASGALGGALMGGTGGALVARNTSDAAMRQVAQTSDEIGRAAQGRAQTLGKTQPYLKSVGQFWKVTKADIVQHPKNMLNDETYGTAVTGLMQGRETLGRVKAIRDDLAGRMKVTDPWQAQPSSTQGLLDSIGRKGYAAKLGTSLVGSEKALADELSAAQTMQASALGSLLAPGGANVLGVAFGAAKGRYAGYRDAFFRAMNGVGNNSFRFATFDQELETGLGLADELLRQKHGIAANALPSGGAFTPADVEQVAGKQAAGDWAAYTAAMVDAAEGRARFLFGDYGQRGRLETLFGGAVPFASWAIRAYPVALAMAVEHPGLALAAFHLVRATSEGAGKDGRPGYTAGMIPIPSDTPLIGPIVGALAGGQANITYVDPLGAFSPVGGDLAAPAEEGKRSVYQQASDTLGRVGLPGFNPLIRVAANATGLDYKDVGSFSRTQGIESALGAVPGNKQLPDVAGSVQRALRGALSPKFAATQLGQVLGAEGDANPIAFDPITRRYAEMVYEREGKPLNDQSNRHYLLALGDPNNALLREARLEVLLGQGIRGAQGLFNPINTVTQTNTARTAKAAKQGEPFTYEQIQEKKAVSPTLAAAMQQSVDQYRKANPAANMYAIGNPEAAERALLAPLIARYKSIGLTAARAEELARAELADQRQQATR